MSLNNIYIHFFSVCLVQICMQHTVMVFPWRANSIRVSNLHHLNNSSSNSTKPVSKPHPNRQNYLQLVVVLLYLELPPVGIIHILVNYKMQQMTMWCADLFTDNMYFQENNCKKKSKSKFHPAAKNRYKIFFLCICFYML